MPVAKLLLRAEMWNVLANCVLKLWKEGKATPEPLGFLTLNWTVQVVIVYNNRSRKAFPPVNLLSPMKGNARVLGWEWVHLHKMRERGGGLWESREIG